ncbi:MAG TPA: hypothetical protein VNZ54_11040, partial [bacterium]|nr:hypothetical protein [bacterium]
LRQKADLQVTSHSYLRDHYLGWGQRLNLYTLFFSAVLLVFTLVSDDFIQRTLGLSPDGFKWAIGTAAFFTFCISLIELAWNPTQKAKAHDQAVAHYLRMNYEIRHLLTTEGKVSREKVRWIQEEYLDAPDLPRIPEARSLWLKQRHLLKLAMTRALERNPHQSLWWLRIKLWWKPGLPLDPAAPMPLPPDRKSRKTKV